MKPYGRCLKYQAKIRTFRGQFCSTTCRVTHKNNISREEQLKTDADKHTWGAEDKLRTEGAPIIKVEDSRWWAQ